jgi:prolipoprotein diacylglyceryltransferase
MSVANSMSMTVIERTREIGTLRAIGLKRSGVIRLFTMESMLLTLIGCVTGLAISFLVGSLWIARRGRTLGYAEDELSRLFLWVLASALVGSRIYYGFQHPEDFRDDWIGIFRVWQGGLTQHGA